MMRTGYREALDLRKVGYSLSPKRLKLWNPGVGGAPDTAKFSSLVAIQLAPDPARTPFT